jgi:hypothetical protein
MDQNRKKLKLTALAILTMATFNILNVYALKTITNFNGILSYTLITMPIQFLAYFGIIWYFSEGVKTFSNKYWIVSVLFTAANYTTNLLAAQILLGQMPMHGQAVGLVLTLIGALVAVTWK